MSRQSKTASLLACFVWGAIALTANLSAWASDGEVEKQAEKAGETAQQIDTTKDISDRMRPSDDAKISKIGEAEFALDAGSVLVHRNKAVRLRTPQGIVQIQKHAAALVIIDNDVTHVIDLFDWYAGCVKIEVGKRTRTLAPGGEISLVFADDETAAERAVIHDGVRRRRIKCVSLDDHHYAVADQCSLVDMIFKQPLLNQLKKSPDKSDQAVYAEIIKTAAAVSLTDTQEPYTVHE